MRMKMLFGLAIAALVATTAGGVGKSGFIDLGKQSVQTVKNACGNDFRMASDGNTQVYGCTKKCGPGGKGTCAVACDAKTNLCTGQCPSCQQQKVVGGGPGKFGLADILKDLAGTASGGGTGVPPAGILDVGKGPASTAPAAIGTPVAPPAPPAGRLQ